MKFVYNTAASGYRLTCHSRGSRNPRVAQDVGLFAAALSFTRTWYQLCVLLKC